MWLALEAPLSFSLLALLATCVGLAAVAWRAEWAQAHANLLALAAAGLLLSVICLHILPDAISNSGSAPIWITLGFFAGLFTNLGMRSFMPVPQSVQQPGDALLPILAISLHSSLDGMVYATTFATSFQTGTYAAGGLILHEIPEGIIAYAILRRGGVSHGSALFWAFISAGLTTPLGVLMAEPFIYGLSPDILSPCFALSAGLLLYVATGPLLSPLREMAPRRALPALGTGVLLALGLRALAFPTPF